MRGGVCEPFHLHGLSLSRPNNAHAFSERGCCLSDLVGFRKAALP